MLSALSMLVGRLQALCALWRPSASQQPERHGIELVDQSGCRTEAVVSYVIQWIGSTRACEVRLAAGALTVTGRGSDVFEAFCRVREELENHGLRPLCYAASRYVYPSGMDRDMCAGLLAYNWPPGVPSSEAMSVAIFDGGPNVSPVTVAEQVAYLESRVQR